jgi:hypothetical protein
LGMCAIDNLLTASSLCRGYDSSSHNKSHQKGKVTGSKRESKQDNVTLGTF